MSDRWQEFRSMAKEIIENFAMSAEVRRLEVGVQVREKLEIDLHAILKNADELPDRLVEWAGWVSYITGILREEFDRVFSKRKDLYDITGLSPFLVKYALYLPEKLKIVAYGSRLYTKDRELIPFYKRISEITVSPERSITKLLSPVRRVKKKEFRSYGKAYFVDYVSSEIEELNFGKLYVSPMEYLELAFDKAPKNSLVMIYAEDTPYIKLYQKLDSDIYFLCLMNNYLYREDAGKQDLDEWDVPDDDEGFQTDMMRFTQDDAYLRLMLELMSMDLVEVSGTCESVDRGYRLGEYFIPKSHLNTKTLRHGLEVTVIGYQTAKGVLKPEIIVTSGTQ